jgi:Family of unknown function (DUF7022)
MPEGTKAKGCIKLRRCSKFRTYYKVQFSATDKNRERRMHRHLRAHPNDAQAVKRYGEESAQGIRLNSKGRKRAAYPLS